MKYLLLILLFIIDTIIIVYESERGLLMKKFSKILLLALLLIITLAGSVFANENQYILTKEMVYESTRKTVLSSGFVEILIGNTNFTQYQKDNEIMITPLPDEITEDEYGNQYAYFDITGLLPGQRFKVTIKRDSEIQTYEQTIPTRSDAEITSETEMYLEPSAKIESDDPHLIAKAKELTEGITTDYKKAQAIFEYVNVNMSYDTSSMYANKGSISALKNMRGVCEEFTTLFVAMCRALDIPARAVEGYKIEDIYESGDLSGDALYLGKELVNHVWAEIYLAEFGWVPVEPTVIYTVNGERKPYLNSFCKIDAPEYISVGIYNPEKANRRIKGVEEIKYTESVIEKKQIAPEAKNMFQDIAHVEWAIDDIQTLYAKGVIKGYSEYEYRPDNSISRIEFIAMLSRVLKYYDTQYEERGLVYYYPDYDETTHWSKEEYDFLLRCYEIINPTDLSSIGFDSIANVFGTGALNPDKAITRAEVVALMDAFLDSSTDSSISFSDVNWSTNFRSSIEKAAANGLINGYPDGTFRPNSSITRAEMAAILGRYITGNVYSIN